MPTQEAVLIDSIQATNRIRKDLGEVDKLADSIKQHGVIQPIVLSKEEDGSIILVAGGRRLTALKRLNFKELSHGREFVWRGEETSLQRRAVELEENLQRKELSWQEELAGKQKLLELMQSIHGLPKVGAPFASGQGNGFGVNKLAAMLREAVGKTSQDLQLAGMITRVPALATLKNKSEALTKLKIVGAVVSMQKAASQIAPTQQERSWQFFEQDFRENTLSDSSVDLIWTDLPYGADIGQMSGQQSTKLATFDDNRTAAVGILRDIATESFRVLRTDRFAVFCFGFTFYSELVRELESAGFHVNVVPVIWSKNSKSGENPNTRYCNSYEPILVAGKGSPIFIRPGKGNVVAFPIVQGKLQSVQKPVELVESFLLDMCAGGATVVDWCAGTGTVGIAAHNLGMRSILFEKEPSMALIARARLESMT